MPVELPSYGAFLDCLNSRFEVVNVKPEPIDLELIFVSALRKTSGQTSFSIIFLGPTEWLMPQHIYRLKHDQLGEMDLFLVPTGKQEKGFEYQAVFTSLNPADE